MGRLPQARHHLQHTFRLLGRAPEHGDVRLERDGLVRARSASSVDLPPKPRDAFHTDVRAAEIGITEGLRRRHVLGAAPPQECGRQTSGASAINCCYPALISF